MECKLPDGKTGFKWGDHGHCYAERSDAEKQAAAAHANGFVGDMALDQSARNYDQYGRLHIARSHISKATVNPYFGVEIPGYEKLGLDPKRVYYLLRSPEELAKAAPTFERLPILSKHIPVTSEAPRQDLIVGTIGSEVIFEDPYLDADTTIWTDQAIAGIETEQVREYSCAYSYVPLMVPGEYNGEKYDGIMTEIRGNHLALVESGRAGPDVLAADSKPKLKFWENQSMEMTKLGKALFVALGAISPKLAQDSGFPALVAKVRKKTFDKDATAKAIIALDSSLDPEKLRVVMDAMSEMEDEPEPKEPKSGKKAGAEDEETEEEKKAREKKEAEDEEEKEKEREKKTAEAMDALRKDLREADEANRAVRPVVGDIIAQDSAAEIYGFALDHLKVDHAGIKEVPALKALFALASSKMVSPAPKVAQDAAGLAAKFPGAARFRQA